MSDGRVRRQRAARSVETHETILTVTASGVGVDEDRREVLQVRKFETEPAYVRVSSGVTKSTGSYESLRVDVAISVPCYVEEVPAVFTRLEAEVAEYLDTALDNYLGE